MKQVLQSRDGTTVVREVPPPSCEPGGILIRNTFSAISSGTERSRVELSQKSLLGKARERPDLVRQVVDKARTEGVRSTVGLVRGRLADETPVGYSSAGIAVEVGSNARGIKPGDAVACAGAGHANHAAVVSVPSNLCAKIPDGVPLEQAAMATIAAISLHGVRLAEVTIGERVAVIGCGLVGRIACKLLRVAGCEVFAIDIERDKLEAVASSDADRVALADEASQLVKRATGGVGVDATLVTAGAPTSEPLVLGAELCRDRGALILVGAVPVDLPRAPLYEKELSFRISRSYGPGRYDANYEERGLDYPIGHVRWTERRNMEAVLELIASSRLDLSDLIDAVVPIERAGEAYERLTGANGERPQGALLLAYSDTAESEPSPDNDDAPTGTPPSQGATTKRSLSARPQLGLIGPGKFASRIVVPAFRAAGAELDLVGGGGGASAERFERRLGFARIAAGADEVIADSRTDAIAICSRHGSHAALTAAALNAGKHVFCEKPLALSEEELAAVLEAEQRSDGVLAVGFNRRFAPHLRQTREFLAQEGPVTLVYRVSAGSLSEDHWTHDLEQGGGRLLGEVCHFIDCALYVFGAPIVAVHAIGHGSPSMPRRTHDNLVIDLTAADGSVGSIIYTANGATAVAKERLEAFAGSRTAILDDYRSLELIDGSQRRRSRSRAQEKGHEAEVAAFITAARTGNSPVPIEEIRNASFATLAAAESLERGIPIKVTP